MVFSPRSPLLRSDMRQQTDLDRRESSARLDNLSMHFWYQKVRYISRAVFIKFSWPVQITKMVMILLDKPDHICDKLAPLRCLNHSTLGLFKCPSTFLSICPPLLSQSIYAISFCTNAASKLGWIGSQMRPFGFSGCNRKGNHGLRDGNARHQGAYGVGSVGREARHPGCSGKVIPNQEWSVPTS